MTGAKPIKTREEALRGVGWTEDEHGFWRHPWYRNTQFTINAALMDYAHFKTAQEEWMLSNVGNGGPKR